MEINSKTVYRGNTQIQIDVPAKLINGRALLPLRFINEIMGKEVFWLDHSGDLKIISVY